MRSNEKPRPEGQRVIEGGVSAQSGDAKVAVNKAADEPAEVGQTPHYVREIPHHRIVGSERHSMTEYVSENDTPLAPVYNGCRFWGHGRLQAQTDLGPMARNYSFPVMANDLVEAWRNFDDCASRAAKVEEQRFREDYQKQLVEMARKQQDGLAVVQGQDAERVLQGVPQPKRGGGRSSLPGS